jgi:4-amino-4-deoxy-L-arabinose transferase-like glycosyltransferase
MLTVNSPDTTQTSCSAAVPASFPSALVIILLVGLIVRLGMWLWFSHVTPGIVDEKDYTLLASNLLEHGEFAFDPGKPTAIRPPLYPFFVSGIYAIAGVENFQAVRLVQALLSLVNVWLLYWLGRDAFSHRVGLWAAGLYAFYPTALGFNNLILTEVLFTLLLTAASYGVVLYFQRERSGYLALSGILLGLAALTRSVVWLSPPFLAVFVILTGRRSLMHRTGGAVLLVLAFALTIAPWAVRNSCLEKTFITIDTMGGRNFMMGNYRYTPLYRSWDAISLKGEQVWYHEVFAVYPPEMLTTQGQIDKLALKQGMKFVREHPGLTILRDVIKFVDFWGLERELVAGAARGYFGPIPSAVVVAGAGLIIAGYVGALFLGIFGIFFCPPPDRRLHWFFLLVIAFICALHTVVFGHSRYHLPLMPLVLLYAAAGWMDCTTIWARRWGGRFAVALSVCLIFMLGWGWNAVAGDWDLIRNELDKWRLDHRPSARTGVITCRGSLESPGG